MKNNATNTRRKIYDATRFVKRYLNAALKKDSRGDYYKRLAKEYSDHLGEARQKQKEYIDEARYRVTSANLERDLSRPANNSLRAKENKRYKDKEQRNSSRNTDSGNETRAKLKKAQHKIYENKDNNPSSAFWENFDRRLAKEALENANNENTNAKRAGKKYNEAMTQYMTSDQYLYDHTNEQIKNFVNRLFSKKKKR